MCCGGKANVKACVWYLARVDRTTFGDSPLLFYADREQTPPPRSLRPACVTLGSLVRRGVPLRLYVPYVKGWFRDWMRRVAEAHGAA